MARAPRNELWLRGRSQEVVGGGTSGKPVTVHQSWLWTLDVLVVERMGSGKQAGKGTYDVEGLIEGTWDNVVLALEKVGEQLHAKPIGEGVRGDAAAARSVALSL